MSMEKNPRESILQFSVQYPDKWHEESEKKSWSWQFEWDEKVGDKYSGFFDGVEWKILQIHSINIISWIIPH